MADLLERRDLARRYATSVVSIAIMAVGGAFVALAILLPLRGGAAMIFLSIILGLLGAAALAGGFFFHLVPSRIDALEEEKRAHDSRERAAKRGPPPRN